MKAYGKEGRGEEAPALSSHTQPGSLTSALNILGQISALSKCGPSHTLLFKRVFFRNYLEKISVCLTASGDNNERLSESFTCLAQSF